MTVNICCVCYSLATVWVCALLQIYNYILHVILHYSLLAHSDWLHFYYVQITANKIPISIVSDVFQMWTTVVIKCAKNIACEVDI